MFGKGASVLMSILKADCFVGSGMEICMSDSNCNAGKGDNKPASFLTGMLDIFRRIVRSPYFFTIPMLIKFFL